MKDSQSDSKNRSGHDQDAVSLQVNIDDVQLRTFKTFDGNTIKAPCNMNTRKSDPFLYPKSSETGSASAETLSLLLPSSKQFEKYGKFKFMYAYMLCHSSDRQHFSIKHRMLVQQKGIISSLIFSLESNGENCTGNTSSLDLSLSPRKVHCTRQMGY
jgi:hypothetical protein